MTQPEPGMPGPSHTPSLTPAQIDAIRDSAAAASTGGDPESGKKLWSALLEQPMWFILDRAELGKPSQPHGVIVQNRRYLAIFSDEARAQAFIAQNHAADAATFHVRGTAPENLLRLAHSLVDQGIFGLQFNAGPHGFAAPLAMAVPIYAEIKQMDLVAAAKFLNGDEFEALAIRAAMSRKSEDMEDLLTRASRLPAWFMLENPGSPGNPAIATLQNGQQALLVFTAQIHAGRAAFAGKINKPDGSVDMIRTSIPEGLRIMREAREKGIPGAVFNIASAAGFPLDFAQLDKFAFGLG